MNRRNKQKFSKVIANNFYMLKKIAKYIPDYFVFKLLHGVAYGFLDYSGTLFSFYLLNTVSDGGDFAKAVIIIGLMAIFQIVFCAFDKWFRNLKDPIKRQTMHYRMHKELFEKSLTLDLSCFDDPQFYNDFVWAMNESDKRAMAVLDETGMLIHKIVGSVSIFTLLFSVEPIIAVVLLASSLITVACNLVGNKLSFEHSKETNPLWRKKSYINRVYHLADYAKELRVANADSLLVNEYDDNNEKIIETDVRYGKKYFLYYGLGWNTIGTITMFAILLYMVFGLKSGRIDVGTFAATTGVVWKIRWILTSLAEHLTKFPQHSLFIEKYLEFTRFEPEIKGDGQKIPDFKSLEFKNVSFSYEFSSHPKYKFHDEDYEKTHETLQVTEALHNINLKIKKGEKVAIVGYNGAGKTTIIKLIMRLYDVTEGEILYNGINIKEFDPVVYRKKIGTVFQDFKIFATSVAHNVMNGDYCEEKDFETVINALKMADFNDKKESLPLGINTHLTREFDDKGTNLSGGESQKIAIARVFANDYPIVIMDEPSSALDPMAEYNLNQSILKNTDNKTVIFISHRLSTTRIADKIYMFDSGKLIEEGSHEELLEINGKYATMFNLQAKRYLEQNAQE